MLTHIKHAHTYRHFLEKLLSSCTYPQVSILHAITLASSHVERPLGVSSKLGDVSPLRRRSGAGSACKLEVVRLNRRDFHRHTKTLTTRFS